MQLLVVALEKYLVAPGKDGNPQQLFKRFQILVMDPAKLAQEMIVKNNGYSCGQKLPFEAFQTRRDVVFVKSFHTVISMHIILSKPQRSNDS